MEKQQMEVIDLPLDWAPATSTEEFLGHLQSICKQFKLQIVGLLPSGPAGGNPEITFRGSKLDLGRMAKATGHDANF